MERTTEDSLDVSQEELSVSFIISIGSDDFDDVQDNSFEGLDDASSDVRVDDFIGDVDHEVKELL